MAKTFSKGRLAASWRPASDCFVRASAATAFRTPALYELYGPSVGDADLDPEESRSLDLDIERRLGEDTYPRGTLFYSETDKLIDDTTTYANMPGTVTRQCGELELGLPLTDAVRLDASYTYTEGDNPSELSGGNAWNLQFSDA